MLELKGLKQEDYHFQVNLGYIARLSQNKNENKAFGLFFIEDA